MEVSDVGFNFSHWKKNHLNLEDVSFIERSPGVYVFLKLHMRIFLYV